MMVLCCGFWDGGLEGIGDDRYSTEGCKVRLMIRVVVRYRYCLKTIRFIILGVRGGHFERLRCE